MQNVWYHLRRPTLVRRIIIAQMLLLTLLWCLFNLHSVGGPAQPSHPYGQ
jgi:hypothetical protein